MLISLILGVSVLALLIAIYYILLKVVRKDLASFSDNLVESCYRTKTICYPVQSSLAGELDEYFTGA
jgi:hypothetical protein